MPGHHASFASLPVGSKFFCNGNRCIKHSTRTAVLVDYRRVFYFGAAETCTIGWPGEE
jgi:hypothetical protein